MIDIIGLEKPEIFNTVKTFFSVMKIVNLLFSTSILVRHI